MTFALDQHGAIVRMDGDKAERIATCHNGRDGAQQLVDLANAALKARAVVDALPDAVVRR